MTAKKTDDAPSKSDFKVPLSQNGTIPVLPSVSVAGKSLPRRSSVTSVSSTTSFPRFDSYPPLLLTNDSSYSRHRQILMDYLIYHGADSKKSPSPRSSTTETEMLAKNHRFLRDETDDAKLPESYEQRLAKRYYDRLFKEYALADFARYQEGRVAMRWRTENEVISGKGQFECANVACKATNDLHSYEINFGYMEAGEKKNALVKLRVCPECFAKLNWKRTKEREAAEQEKMKRKKKEEEKKRRHRRESEGGGGGGGGGGGQGERNGDANGDIENGVEMDDMDNLEGHQFKRRRIEERTGGISTSGIRDDDPQHDEESDGLKPISKVYSQAEASRIWSKQRKEGHSEDKKTREEEFESYLESLFQ